MDTPTQQDYMDVTNLLVGHYTQSSSHMGVSISTGHKDPSFLFFLQRNRKWANVCCNG